MLFRSTELWERIVLNLVSNAFKYSAEGEISVGVYEAGDTVRISVTDTGVGIPADQLDKIFDRFHRIENSGARSLEGTGIGLAICEVFGVELEVTPWVRRELRRLDHLVEQEAAGDNA